MATQTEKERKGLGRVWRHVKRYALNMLHADSYYDHFTRWQFANLEAQQQSSAVSFWLTLDSSAIDADIESGDGFTGSNLVIKDKKQNVKYCVRTALEMLSRGGHNNKDYQDILKSLKRTIDYQRESMAHIRAIPWDPENEYETGMRLTGGTVIARNATYAYEDYLDKLEQFYADIQDGRLKKGDGFEKQLKELQDGLEEKQKLIKDKYIYKTQAETALMNSFIGQRAGFTALALEWDVGFIERQDVTEKDLEEARRNFEKEDKRNPDTPLSKRQSWNLLNKGLQYFRPGERAAKEVRHPPIALTSHQKWLEGIHGGGQSGGDAARASEVLITQIEKMLNGSKKETGEYDYDGVMEGLKWLVMQYSSNEFDEEHGVRQADRSQGIPFDFTSKLKNHLSKLQMADGNQEPWSDDLLCYVEACQDMQNNRSGANVLRLNWKKMGDAKRIERFRDDIVSEKVSTKPML